MKDRKISLFSKDWFFTIIASLSCIVAGLMIGFIVLLFINPSEAPRAMLSILENFFFFKRSDVTLEYLGSTLVKAAPLLMCTLSVVFAYKTGLFNIGASGQFTVGAGLCLYMALAWKLPWYVCLIGAILGGAIMGSLVGVLKAYCNVNEVISSIMLNWISLYLINLLLTNVKETSTTNTIILKTSNSAAILPSLGLSKLFSDNQYVTIAVPLSIMIAILIWFIFKKTVFGYELKATGLNIDAARYAGMHEHRNIIVSMAISGALAGAGAAFLYLSGIVQWDCAATSVPAMGFNGIAAAFLGGLHPIGNIFAVGFIQHITEGGNYVDKMIYCSQISDLIVAIIIYSCSFIFFIKVSLKRRREKKSFEKNNTQKGENAP